METSILAIVIAVIAQFGVSAFWYMIPFGAIWGKMHDFDKLSKEKQKELQSKMGPWYGIQLVMTILTTVVMALVINNSDYSPYATTGLAWLGFTLPAQASAAIFGGAKSEWVWHKIAISSACSLLCYMITAFILVTL